MEETSIEGMPMISSSGPEVKSPTQDLDNSLREAIKSEDHTKVVHLYRDIIVDSQEKTIRLAQANKILTSLGEATKMKRASTDLAKYMEKHEDEVDPRERAFGFRTLGRIADINKNYSESETFYKKSLSYFDSLTKPEDRFNRLELAGFLAVSQIKQGNEQGLHLAVQTLKDFDTSPEGVLLKEKNYSAWAVWKSGLGIRVAEYLGSKKDPEHTKLAREMFDDVESILQTPDGNQNVLKSRFNELNAAKRVLAP
jgi:hypothetical protein